MKTPSYPAAQNALRTTRHFFRRFLGIRPAHERVRDDSGSYVGLFQGVIETDASAAQALPTVTIPTAGSPKSAARTSGFLRLEVNDKKKATGCFLFFVDGKVLSGDIEGASEQTGFVEASFRLKPERAQGRESAAARPVLAVGKLHLEARHGRGAAAPGEDLTIRFV